MRNRRITLLLGFIGLISVSALLGPARANADTPQFLITWKTSGSYIPSAYIGKALPTYGSNITASLTLLSKGVPVNLSGQTIYWYLNSTLLGGGTGAQTITFPPLGDAPNLMSLEVDIPNYNGSYLIQTVNIPMAQPVAVVRTPFPDGTFSANPLTVAALPYFFNIDSAAKLSYAWSVNSQTGSNTENPDLAQITLPAGTPAGTSFDISLSISNANDSTKATALQTLTYEPRP